MTKKKKKKEKKASVHKDLEGLDLRINKFGEVESNIDVARINKFLDKNVKDKKIEEKEAKEAEAKKKKKPSGDDKNEKSSDSS